MLAVSLFLCDNLQQAMGSHPSPKVGTCYQTAIVPLGILFLWDFCWWWCWGEGGAGAGRGARESFCNSEYLGIYEHLWLLIKNFLRVPEVMGREDKGWEKILLEKHHLLTIGFLSLKPAGLSCFVKVKSLRIRGATRGRSEDLRSSWKRQIR